jgi:hypothetical protein
MTFTSTTPRTARAALSSTEIALPPNRGGCATSTVSASGRATSMVYSASPVDFSGESSLGTALPIKVNCCGSLSFTSFGGVILAACSASSPNVACLVDALWRTTPLRTLISCAGTPHSCAAAATSIARAVAPALRICS